MARDSRAEARKAWRQMRKAWRQIRTYLPLRDREHFKRVILLILTDLARREYEAGYEDGTEAVRAFPNEWGVKSAVVIDRQARRRG